MELTDVKGVGDKTIKVLNKLGIYDINDLINYYPFRYQIYDIKKLSEVDSSDTVVINAKVETNANVYYIKRNLNRLTFKAVSDNILFNVTIFNRAFMKQHIIAGKEITLIGKWEKLKNTFVASDIKLESMKNNEIEPIYHLNKDIKNKALIKIIENALSLNIKLDDYIPFDICDKYGFISKNEAVNEIHNPTSSKMLKQAKIRLIYEELFIFMFKIMYLKYRNDKMSIGLKRSVDYKDVDKFITSLPFMLTNDQLSTVNVCFEELNSNKRMNRLILGDVGSGKTIVAIISMYINYLAGYQGTMMAPTEILAKQHFKNIINLTKNTDIVCELLVGSMTAREKKNIKERLLNGEIDILIGTHALITDDVEFKNLGLVITDEQHRFGVNQRKNLQNKGELPDIIYLSATPIPRTYALTIYGDMDTSLIKEKPNGRKEIITKTKKSSELKDVLYHMLEEIKAGHQIYVVSSLIDSEEENNLNDVMKLKEKMDIAFKNKINIGILHGKMKNDEKESIMNDFKNGIIRILICTTIVEVGVDVENATMMVIFDADRFGLATLHQLRGRVGRNDLQSYCYLICDKEKERLNVMCESNDGFYISQKDFEIRGEGDLFGVNQSGDMAFKIANIKQDYKILLQAKEDVIKFIEQEKYKNSKFYIDIINSIDFLN
ncbi:MAG: ATP-dependent DNA helicase RecG [Firmicutes bacterium]|nr:ATP-dependent DNA helicase RecG [Bacillota bacterium]